MYKQPPEKETGTTPLQFFLYLSSVAPCPACSSSTSTPAWHPDPGQPNTFNCGGTGGVIAVYKVPSDFVLIRLEFFVRILTPL